MMPALIATTSHFTPYAAKSSPTSRHRASDTTAPFLAGRTTPDLSSASVSPCQVMAAQVTQRVQHAVARAPGCTGVIAEVFLSYFRKW